MAGIYIHVPFCKQACHYCNFYFSTSLGNKDRFVQALLKEIQLSKEYLAGENLETIYLGGGTPSLLTAAEIKSIIEQLGRYHNLSSLKEFTLEANPDDLTLEKINEFKELKQYGLNRFSIGIQSFFDEDLKYMNRAHNSAEAQSAVKRVQDAGFEKLTLDLIYGTPTMNDDRWQQNLETAFALNVPHISSYALTVEDKTSLQKRISKGESRPVDEEQSARQFKILMEQMRAHGYEQYEISNFAKPGRYAVHNTNYWFGKKYLGLGPSAHSFNGSSRRWNVANNISYINSINEGRLPFEEEILTPAQQCNEKIMTALRTQWGLRISECGTRNAELIQNSLKDIDAAHYTLIDGVLKLTEEGKFFADAIAAKLFVEE
ncbi:MAG TPA: radical SAM family heme chaperone HemW [Chitinophagales bacterium]|nr:radical SAM family heme chaperone HemW [Chitinophagales bacterium]